MVPMKDSPFNSTASIPYVSAPSSPRFANKPFGYYCHYGSAPTSPTRASAIYAAPMAPFDREEALGTPKPKSHVGGNDDINIDDDDDNDFEFEFSGHLEKGGLPPELTSADKLFEQGKIRPLKPSPEPYNLDTNDKENMVSSPTSPKGEPVSPFQKKDMVTSTSTSRSREGSRSLPSTREELRGSFMMSPNNSSYQPSTSAASPTTKSSCRGSGKWSLRDLLLFRNKPEGRVTGNRSVDPTRKLFMLRTFNSSNSSFRSMDSVRSSTRRGIVSSHEKHYTSNKAAAEEKKTKTALPFSRHGLFGCLKYNPAVQSITQGFHNNFTFKCRPRQ